MPSLRRILRVLASLLAVICCLQTAEADVTPEQSQELRQLKRDLGKVTSLLRKKEFDEVQTLLDDAEAKVQAIMDEADVAETNRRLLGLPRLIAARRKALELQRGKAQGKPAGGVSFKADIAPLIVDKCLDCHGPDNPGAGLDLSTFAGWKQGGRSGALLVPGAALNSCLIVRLGSNDPKVRMPRDDDPLPRQSLELIAVWINQGARFDGDNETASLADMTRPRPKVNVPKPRGNETVSFTNDIAPFMVGLCVRCHSGNEPRGGLSLVTFADMMAGGDSGPVILPGKREESRLFRLVGGLENPRMPQGQARITRKNYEDLVKWFDEGNVFDGDDPYAALTSYAPTPAQMASKRFAAMSADELAAHRRERTEELWKASLPNHQHESLESEQFLLAGDVTPERLTQVNEWAVEHLQWLMKTFGESSHESTTPVWKGKLTILVFGDRFGFDEYSRSVLDRPAQSELFGNAVVTPTFSDAYIVLQDVGDAPDETHPGLRGVLRDHLTGAFISRPANLPDWLVRGCGLHFARQADRSNPYYKSLPNKAEQSLASLGRPESLIVNGTFSPATVGPVGFVMVEFLVDRTNSAKLVKLIQSLQQGSTLEEALPAVTGSSPAAFLKAFLASVRRGR